MTSWLVTGAGGMLGRDMTAVLRGIGADVLSLDHAALDVTDPEAVKAMICQARPDVVVNCAAWTAVDDAESAEDAALAVNGAGPAHVAAACAAAGARMVQVSTDYVFAGTHGEPYPEDYPPAPLTAYGRTKLAGERAVLSRLPDLGFVVRTAWLYGAHGPNFVRTMIRLEGEQPEVGVVDDQQGQPTWTVDLARQVVVLIEAGAKPGVYHATSQGTTTWFGLAEDIFRLLGADPARVRRTTTTALGRPAPRPAYSVLGHDQWEQAGLPPLPHWREALSQAFPAIAAMAEAAARQP
jgi:dTDP-4-dehydrorhamnose reductase